MKAKILTVIMLFICLSFTAAFGAEAVPAEKDAGATPAKDDSPAAAAGAVEAKSLNAAKDEQAEVFQSYERLVHVMDLVKSHYVQPIESRQLFEGAIKGILESLDPYSAYIPPADFTTFKEETEQQFSGIGITIAVEKDRVKIVTTLEGMPAFRAGVLPGDYITKVDGKTIDELGPREDIVKHLRGAVGTSVSVTFFRPSTTREYTVDLVREEIPITTLRGYSADPKTNKWEFMIDDKSKIGYIRLAKFSQNTAKEFDDAYAALVERGMKGLVIDLRYNPGGLLDVAIEIADRFLDQGLIVRTQGRAGIFNEQYAKPGDTYKTAVALVLLVNEWSASASEVLGGALKDHARAVLVGTRTYGKGSVQNILDLDGEGAVKLTVAYYYTPSGKLVHRLPGAKEWGLDPDVAQTMSTDEQIKLRDLWSDVSGGKTPTLLGEGGGAIVDIQLSRGLDILRGMLLAGQESRKAGE